MNRVPVKHKQGRPRGTQERKLQGCQIYGPVAGEGGEGTFLQLLQGAKINYSLGPPVCDLLETPLIMIKFFSITDLVPTAITT